MTPEQTYIASVEAAAREFRARRDQIKMQAEAAVDAAIATFNQREAQVYASSGHRGRRAQAVTGTGQGDVRLGFIMGGMVPR